MTTNHKRRVAFLLLDGVEQATIQYYIDRGVMPFMQSLFESGTTQPVASRETYAAEATPTEMVTGRPAEENRYWSVVRFDPSDYSLEGVGAYRGPAWYEADAVTPVVCDVPHIRIPSEGRGVHVAAWGAHSPQHPRESYPAPVMGEILDRFGPYHDPAFEDIHGWHNRVWARNLIDYLKSGSQRRPELTRYLLEQAPDWDVAFLGLTEAHVLEHQYHHVANPHHPLHEHPNVEWQLPLLEEGYADFDRCVERMVGLFDDDVTVVIGAVHGAKASATDTTQVLLAEMALRHQTGRRRLDLPEVDGEVTLEQWQRPRGYMQRHLNRPGFPHEPGIRGAVEHWARFLSHRLPPALEWKVEQLFRRVGGQEPDWAVATPAEKLLNEPPVGPGPDPLRSEPSCYLTDQWPEMRWFVMPSFSGVQVRINLQGRERDGIVPADEYKEACEEAIQFFAKATDRRTGKPVVTDVEWMLLDDPHAPDGPAADLVMVCDAATTLDHPDVGSVGTVPYGRVAEHSGRGWLLSLDGLAPSDGPIGVPIDIGPTLLALAGHETGTGGGRPLFDPAAG